jgi:hypothetical protein
LPKIPAAERIDIDDDGNIIGYSKYNKSLIFNI